MSLGRKRTCFVVMPFGEKLRRRDTYKAAPQAPAGGEETIDFDAVYNDFIVPTIENDLAADLPMDCVRSDKWSRSGSVHKEMIDHLLEADVVIVDVTTHNANVFYELGIRHSFRSYTTVLIRREGERIPFNITTMRVVDYNIDTPEKAALSRQRLAQTIRTSFSIKDNDSLVHEVLRDVRLSRPSVPIFEQERWSAKLKVDPERQIGFITGDILNIKCVDVWVNPENTKMQMARYHDGSVSSNIRYFGARHLRNGFVKADTISTALTQGLKGSAQVEAGTVIATTPGTLGRDNGLKLILHVAAMQGEPGRGYQPVNNVEHCVWWALEELDHLEKSWWKRPTLSAGPIGYFRRPAIGPVSVLFPLFGSRSNVLEPQTLTDKLFRAAAVFFELNRETVVRAVYFLAYTEQDRRLCEVAMGSLKKHDKLVSDATRESESTAAPLGAGARA